MADRESKDHIDMLYKEYRTEQDRYEPNIQHVLEFARRAHGAADEKAEFPLFADFDEALSEHERSVLLLYRQYQEERFASDAVDAERLKLDIDAVLARCQPLITSRAEAAARSVSTPVDTAAASQGLLAKLGRLFFAPGSRFSVSLGAMAAVALAVIGISLFNDVDDGANPLELTGVSTYAELGTYGLSDRLPPPSVGALGFSPSDDTTIAAYAIGGLVGELGVSVAGNDKERGLQAVHRIDGLRRTSNLFAPDDATMSAAIDNAKTGLNASAAAQLREDKAVLAALESLLTVINERNAANNLGALQQLGSWTLIAQALTNSRELEADAPSDSLFSRLFEDAERIHQEIRNRDDLSASQSAALSALAALLSDYRAEGLSDATWARLKQAANDIDTSFRI